jgi:hypothetical protein
MTGAFVPIRFIVTRSLGNAGFAAGLTLTGCAVVGETEVLDVF